MAKTVIAHVGPLEEYANGGVAVSSVRGAISFLRDLDLDVAYIRLDKAPRLDSPLYRFEINGTAIASNCVTAFLSAKMKLGSITLEQAGSRCLVPLSGASLQALEECVIYSAITSGGHKLLTALVDLGAPVLAEKKRRLALLRCHLTHLRRGKSVEHHAPFVTIEQAVTRQLSTESGWV